MSPTLTATAARALGMKEREIRTVERCDGGYVVVTHDGYPTLVTDSGEFVFGAEAIEQRLAPVPEAPAGVDDEDLDDVDAVPDGSAEAVLAWVIEDPALQCDRVGRALVAELAKERPRSGLTGHLEKLLVPAE